MDGLELGMEGHHILERPSRQRLVLLDELRHAARHLLGGHRLANAHLVGEALVVADREPSLATVGRSLLELGVQALDEALGQAPVGGVDDSVDAPEVAGGLQDVVHAHRVCDADRVGLEDEPGLLVREPAPLDAVGVIGKLDLDVMVDPPGRAGGLLLAQNVEKRAGLRPRARPAARALGVFWDGPRLSDKLDAGNATVGTVVAYRALGDAPELRRIGNREKRHGRPPSRQDK